MWNAPTLPEPRWVTREEWAVERATYPLRWEVGAWKAKRRKTHRLLKLARARIARLTAENAALRKRVSP